MGQATPSATGLSLMLNSQASYVIVSGFRAALDLDTYPLSNFIRPRYAERAKRGRGKPVLIMHIGFFRGVRHCRKERTRFRIYRKISRFQDPFSDFSRDFTVVRGRPIARARSVVPVPVRPSATQRVPEC